MLLQDIHSDEKNFSQRISIEIDAEEYKNSHRYKKSVLETFSEHFKQDHPVLKHLLDMKGKVLHERVMIDVLHFYNIYKGLSDEDNIITGNKEEGEESKLTPANEKPKDRRVKGPQKANIYGRNKSRFT